MKKILSLALALAVCLSLLVPAFAAEPYTFENSQIKITNVVETDLKDDYEGAFTCVAPAHFEIGAVFSEVEEEHDDYYEVGLSFWKFPDDADINADNYMNYTVEPDEYFYEAADNTLTEPGRYWVEVWESFGDGGGFTRYLAIILPGEGDVQPAPKPDTDGPTTLTGFTDVKAGDWFYDAVQWAVEQEITTGTTATTFSPANTCTEAQILTFLWRAKGCPAPEKAIPSDQYYAQAAGWAVQTGILDEFEANTPCTRAMTVEYLWKAAGKPQSSAKPAFTDIEGDGELAKAVAWAVETGVTTGTSDTTFSPSQICSRGQIVTFLYRAFAQ